MKLASKLNSKSKTFCMGKYHILYREKRISLDNSKFYQKLIVVFISLSTFLIYPESPLESENICESYNSRQLCNVW